MRVFKVFPIALLAASLTLASSSWSLNSFAEDLNIYQPASQEPDDSALAPVSYPSITPTSSLMEIPANNQTTSTKAVLKLSSPPSSLGPNATPDFTLPVWQKSQLPQLQIPSKAIQPVSSLPALASAELQPMALTPEDVPTLRNAEGSVQVQGTVKSEQILPEPAITGNTEAPSNNSLDPLQKAKPKKAEKIPRPVVYYTPLPAIAVFPVLKSGTNQMFADVPLLFAKEFARRLEIQAPGTKVLNPYYTTEAMKARGLDRTYNKIMKDYMYAGRPDPVTLDYFLKQLNEGSDRPISRVFFVEADLDTNNPMSPKGLGGAVDRIRNAFDGSTPDYMKYYVRSHVQAYDTEDQNMPQIWNFNWNRDIRADRFNNVTASVFVDADALRAFTETSGFLSKAALLTLPKAVYMEEHVDSSVQGHLAGKEDGIAPTENQNSPNEDPGMQPISSGLPGSETESMGNGMKLREHSGKPKRPNGEAAKQIINQVTKWTN